MKRFVLVTAEQVREIFERAYDNIENGGIPIHGGEEARDRAQREFDAAREALRFCCAQAMLLEDPSLIDVIVDTLNLMTHRMDEPDSAVAVAARALPLVLGAGAPVNAAIRDLATSDNPDVREAIAQGLKPLHDDAAQLLQQLAADRHPSVREAARKSLGNRFEIPWWKGKFDTDPLPRMSTEEAEAAREPIEKLALWLDEPTYKQYKAGAELAALAVRLPSRLALEVLRNVIRSWYIGSAQGSPVGSALLRLPGGLDALIPVLEQWSDAPDIIYLWPINAVSSWMSQLDAADHTRLCDELLERLSLPAEDRPEGERYRRPHPHSTLAGVLGRSWPKDRDLTSLFERVIDAEVEPSFCLKAALEQILEREDIVLPAALRSRFAEAKLAGYPGGFARLGWQSRGLVVDRLPPSELRVVAERAAASDDASLMEWGWELLTGKLQDTERDGSRLALLERLLADPNTRSTVLESSDMKRDALPLLRAELRSGHMDFEGSMMVLRTINTHFGGVVSMMDWAGLATLRKHKRKDVDLPREWKGPPTDEEWNAFRRVRDPAIASDEAAFSSALMVLPTGPWAPEDRHIVDRVIAEFRAGTDKSEVEAAYVLASKPLPEAPAIFDEILALHDGPDSILRECHRVCLEQFGIKQEPTPEADEDKPDSSEGDSDEDDGWDNEDANK